MQYLNHSSNHKTRKVRKASLSLIISVVRCIYVLVAAGIVCRGFYHAIEKFISEDVSTRQEYHTVERRRYPSITFCYKYKHGTKRVIDNYLPKFKDKAKEKGTSNVCLILLLRNDEL